MTKFWETARMSEYPHSVLLLFDTPFTPIGLIPWEELSNLFILAFVLYFILLDYIFEQPHNVQKF